jgi:hypothetical protein
MQIFMQIRAAAPPNRKLRHIFVLLLLATAVGFLADHMWRKGGAYSLWSSRYIYNNINTAIKSK